MKSQLKDESQREMNVIFIHSSVDDAELTASEFRVYGHLARRASSGQAWPGIASMAIVCKMHPDTIRAAIKELIARKMISRKLRPGFTPIYTITAPSTWKDPSESKGGVESHPSEKEGGESSLTFLGESPERDGGEGNPLKGIQEDNPKGEDNDSSSKQNKPIKTSKRKNPSPQVALPPLPEKLRAVESEWEHWQNHLQEIGRPLTWTAAILQMEVMKTIGSPQAIKERIMVSINNRWPGIYLSNDQKTKAPAGYVS